MTVSLSRALNTIIHISSKDESVAWGTNCTKLQILFSPQCRSWRTFLTMMQWSKRRQSSWIQLAGHQGTWPVLTLLYTLLYVVPPYLKRLLRDFFLCRTDEIICMQLSIYNQVTSSWVKVGKCWRDSMRWRIPVCRHSCLIHSINLCLVITGTSAGTERTTSVWRTCWAASSSLSSWTAKWAFGMQDIYVNIPPFKHLRLQSALQCTEKNRE